MTQVLRLIAIGMIMGAAEVVPGVSGGTIAFVTGIYSRLINAIRECNPGILLVLKRDGFKSAWQRIDGNFLIALAVGMGLAIILFARAVGYLLDEHTIFIWSFFSSLVLCSVWLVVKQIKRMDWQEGLFLGCGIAVGLIVTNLAPVEVEPTPMHIFIGGAIAVCAWVLPGLSGSFILLILGLYRFVIDAVKSMDIVVIVTLGAGCAVGLMLFSQILSRLLSRFHDQTLAVLAGFMLGSLLKLWPWQQTLSYQLKSDGSQVPLQQKPLLPLNYQDVTGADPQFMMAFLGLALGVIAVLGLNWISNAGDDEKFTRK